jgi:hypothetical protein
MAKVTGSLSLLDEVGSGSGLLVSGRTSLVGFRAVVSTCSPTRSYSITSSTSKTGSTCTGASQASSSGVVARVLAEGSDSFTGDVSVT